MHLLVNYIPKKFLFPLENAYPLLLLDIFYLSCSVLETSFFRISVLSFPPVEEHNLSWLGKSQLLWVRNTLAVSADYPKEKENTSETNQTGAEGPLLPKCRAHQVRGQESKEWRPSCSEVAGLRKGSKQGTRMRCTESKKGPSPGEHAASGELFVPPSSFCSGALYAIRGHVFRPKIYKGERILKHKYSQERFLFVFHFRPLSQHVAVPRPGIKPVPQQWPEPQQRQHQILNPLNHQGTPIQEYFNRKYVDPIKHVHMKLIWLTCYFQETILQSLKKQRHPRNKLEAVNWEMRQYRELRRCYLTSRNQSLGFGQ